MKGETLNKEVSESKQGSFELKVRAKNDRIPVTIERTDYNMNGTTIAVMNDDYPYEEQKANAQRIVTAVNEYDHLEEENASQTVMLEESQMEIDSLHEVLKNLVDRDLIKNKDGDHYEEILNILHGAT